MAGDGEPGGHSPDSLHLRQPAAGGRGLGDTTRPDRRPCPSASPRPAPSTRRASRSRTSGPSATVGPRPLPNPVHVYGDAGLYMAQLALSDGAATITSRVILIEVGTPPQGAITSPAHSLPFRAGDIITFPGRPAIRKTARFPAAAYSWTILFHHDSHVHPTLGPVSGTTRAFTIPTPATTSPARPATRSS